MNGSVPEENFSAAPDDPEGPTVAPVTASTPGLEKYKFDKDFQIRVLKILVLLIIVLCLFEIFKVPVLKEVLPLIVPIFTFLIGMSVKPQS